MANNRQAAAKCRREQPREQHSKPEGPRQVIINCMATQNECGAARNADGQKPLAASKPQQTPQAHAAPRADRPQIWPRR
jgi:hypothetical protein